MKSLFCMTTDGVWYCTRIWLVRPPIKRDGEVTNVNSLFLVNSMVAERGPIHSVWFCSSSVMLANCQPFCVILC